MNFKTFRPSYFFHRLAQEWYWRRHPRQPWMNRHAILALEGLIKPSDRCLEWGSGRSTLWLGARVSAMVSIENHPTWFGMVTTRLQEAGLERKVDYRLRECPADADDRAVAVGDCPYVQVAQEFADGAFDIVVVDGQYRAQCFREAARLLKSGGILVLDNADRFFANSFEAGTSSLHEPRSAPPAGPWEDIARDFLGTWRWIHTSDGVCETRILVKP